MDDSGVIGFLTTVELDAGFRSLRVIHASQAHLEKRRTIKKLSRDAFEGFSERVAREELSQSVEVDLVALHAELDAGGYKRPCAHQICR